MKKVLWAVTSIGTIVGGFFAVVAFNAESAPQQAALAALGTAFAVIPYCLARARDEFEK
jgi:hypothetical protein